MRANPFSLEGKVALVTGGNTGLGQAFAQALAGAGADIVSTSRRPADETAAQVKALGRRFLSIQADLGTIKPIAGIVEHTIKEFGRLDILVNNAGVIRRADSVEFTEEDWDAVVDTNLKSAFFPRRRRAAT
jgi:2-deoxy-D-gluconate 3-dehydrogenase